MVVLYERIKVLEMRQTELKLFFLRRLVVRYTLLNRFFIYAIKSVANRYFKVIVYNLSLNSECIYPTVYQPLKFYAFPHTCFVSFRCEHANLHYESESAVLYTKAREQREFIKT